jgi:putative DNA primase/helicase
MKSTQDTARDRLREAQDMRRHNRAERARKANGHDESTSAARATIRIVKGQIARMTDEAEVALIAAANIAPILVRAGMLVQPSVEQLQAAHGLTTEATLFRPLTAANIVYLLNKHAASFERYNERGKDWFAVDPPAAVATQLREKGTWLFPKVDGIITTPTLRPDGTILDHPGYDLATRLWYAQDSHLAMPPLINNPSREQAEQALRLLEDLLVNFPFAGDLDRAVALAAILTPLLRGAFDVAPMHLIVAHDVGSGKSYLVNLISTIIRGRPCPVITFVKSIEEMEKRLGALVLRGATMISLDNCSADVGGDLLCQMTEQSVINIRILGLSEAPECEWRGVLFGTGNNVTLLGDMTRRGLIANLNAKVERPELREFNFDPIKRVLANRGAYIAAAITIARAYIAAGNPKVCGPLGSYSQWSRVVRSPLIWLGREDPVKSMEQAREEDPIRRAVNTLITIWREHLTLDLGYTAADIAARATERLPPELHELLMQQAGTARGDIDPRKVGTWLTSIHGRIHKGHHIERMQDQKRGNHYALRKS